MSVIVLLELGRCSLAKIYPIRKVSLEDKLVLIVVHLMVHAVLRQNEDTELAQ